VDPLAAPAAEFQVTTIQNSGTGSLRQAIEDLNDLGAVADEQHRIVFDGTLIDDDSVIVLLTPLEDVAVDVEFDASDVSNLSLQGPDSTFLRTDTTRVTLIDLGTRIDPVSLESAIAIGASDELGFDTSEMLDIEIESNIIDAATQGGALVKDGLGTLTLSGQNSYSGGTTIKAGTLHMTGTPPDSGRIDIEEDATLVFDATDAFKLLNELNGSGTLVKRADTPTPPDVEPHVELLGGGAFTGLTRIEGGTLTDASGVIRGDVVLGGSATPAKLAFDVFDSRTYSGTISGTGGLAKAGFGTLTLLGDNNYAGTTFLDGGTLIGSTGSIRGDVEVGLFSTLVFDQATSGSFAGDISEVNGPFLSPLTLEKRGAGTVQLTGIVAASGGTAISQGRLEVDGLLGSPTRVEAGAVLGGTASGPGSAVLGAVTVLGAISPGREGDTGTLQIAFVDFQPGSVLEVDIRASSGDTLSVLGHADISGARVRLVTEPGSYATPVTRKILETNTLVPGTLTSTFDGFETDFAFLETSFDYPPLLNEVWVTIADNGKTLASFAATPNQVTVEQLLKLEDPGKPGSDLEAVFKNIQVMSSQQAQLILDAIGGEPLSAFPTVQLALGERLNRVVHRRARDPVWGKPDALFTVRAAAPAATRAANRRFAAGPVAALPAPGARRAQARSRRGSAGPLRTFEGNTGVGAWLDGWGSRGGGATLGLDYRFGERFSAGLAAGYANADIELDGRASQGDVDLAQGALYAGYVDPRFHVSASGRYGRGWNDSERRITFGTADRKAKASFESRDVGARVEIGANALRLGPLAVAPLAAFDWAQLRRDDFAESGAGELGLVVEDDSLTSLLGSLGGSLRGSVDLGDDVAMVAELRVFGLHEFGDVERAIRARLSGAVASGSFEILGAELPRDRILAGLGWSASIGDVVRVFADYDVALASGLLQHEATLTLRMHF
jgi:outer membrane autotransporter protein